MALTEALAPLFLVIVPFMFVYTSASIYRSIYPEDTIRSALQVVAEYRALKAEAARSKRRLKKARALEPEYRKARRLLLRASLVKSGVLLVTYITGSLLFLYTLPAILSPYHIPVITVVGETGVCAAYSFMIYFLAYVLFFILFRDSFL